MRTIGFAIAGLLAPVPEVHLASGVKICRTQGRVAFGSDAWEVFRSLDQGAGRGLPVAIYASFPTTNLGPTISWAATYVEVVPGLVELEVAVPRSAPALR